MSISEQTSQLIDVLFAKFGIVIDWTNESVMPYLATLFNKLVTYEIWTSVAWIVLTIVPFIVCLVLVKKYWKDGNGDVEFEFALGFPTVFTGAAFVLAVFVQTMDIVKCVTFPEMFVLEYIQELISK